MGRMTEKFEEICEPQCSVKTILHNYVLYHICEKSNYAKFFEISRKIHPKLIYFQHVKVGYTNIYV